MDALTQRAFAQFWRDYSRQKWECTGLGEPWGSGLTGLCELVTVFGCRCLCLLLFNCLGVESPMSLMVYKVRFGTARSSLEQSR